MYCLFVCVFSCLCFNELVKTHSNQLRRYGNKVVNLESSCMFETKKTKMLHRQCIVAVTGKEADRLEYSALYQAPKTVQV